MIIVWGTLNAGKVDQVPGGMFHVMTQFGHVYYLPIIPTGSYLVLEQNADGFRGLPIPMSFKSILTAWLRAGSVVAIIASLVMTMIFLADIKPLLSRGFCRSRFAWEDSRRFSRRTN